MIVEFPYSLFSERGLRETTLWGPKRPENVPVAHFQRRPGGSPEPKATLTGTRQSQNGKDAQRFDVFIQEKYNNVTIQSQVIGRFKSGRK